jgi:asparagine synthase (glutamine-hydrolysing)
VCGIAGFLAADGLSAPEELSAIALAMGRAIAHRGPDDWGVWTDAGRGLAFAHRRLSVIDLSPEGHQPMASPSGRFVAVFNGEIYNYLELRAELEQAGRAPAWRGHSDTEVLLAACDAWGIEGALQRSNGMFAMALADLAADELVLARDRMGEKPLYYGWQGRHFLFGSELKALRTHPQFQARVEPLALSRYIRFGYVPAPLSIYAGIRKLPPATILRVPLRGSGTQTPRAYWHIPLPAADRTLSGTAAVDRLDTLLRDAIRCRMHSDVPLGAFLSGGIDSSTIAALMQNQSSRPVRTYSIGFREQSYDESAHARAVAKALGTDHSELHVTAMDALAVVPHLPQLYDEPFADSSAVPTYLLSRLTRQHVTVALSGDGGDELFGGYVRYVQGRTLLGVYRTVPRSWRRVGARGLRLLAGRNWARLSARAPRSLGVMFSSGRLGKLAEVLPLSDHRELYGRLVSQWPDATLLTRFDGPAPGISERDVLEDELLANAIDCPASWMMYVDQLTYLPDDILVKVDRASMAVALEARVPFLDHRLVEFAASVPLELKVRQRRGKWVLREVLRRYLDPRLTERPKQGFELPIAEWLRGPLREWAEDLLSPSALADTGVIRPEPVRRVWADHLDGRRNSEHRLWVVLMLQAWWREAAPSLHTSSAANEPAIA